MRDASFMIKEMATPMAWKLIRHYLDPHVRRGKYHHTRSKIKYNEASVVKVPKSTLIDANAYNDGDDVLINPKFGFQQHNPFYTSELAPQGPDDSDPQVVWLLSFPNSVRFARGY